MRGGHDKSRPIGLRSEFRINMRSKGIDFADKTRAYPAFSVLAFIGL